MTAPMTLAQRLREMTRLQPDARAITLLFGQHRDPVSFTYAELLAGARTVARELAAAGVKPGEVVLLLFDHGEALLLSYFAALELGAIPSILAPASTKVPPHVYDKTLRAVIESSRAGHVVTDNSRAETLAAAAREALGTAQLVPLRRESRTSELPPHTFDVEHTLDAEAVALVQYSSGTTGLRKGVALSHRAVLGHIDAYADAIALAPSDRIVSWLPLYHDMGLIAGFLLPLLRGIPLVLMSPFDWIGRPVSLLETLDRERGTLSWLPNFAYNLLATRVSEKDMATLDLSSVRGLINCSEPVRADSHRMFLERFRGVGLRPEALWSCYAMAETTFAVTQGGVREALRQEEIDADAYTEQGGAVVSTEANPSTKANSTRRTVVSSGRPIAGCEVRVVDNARRPLPERRVGEIAVRSSSMFSEYLRAPDKTRAALEDGWFFTGDLGYIADGHLFVTGRKKDLIIVAGKNIHPDDIEEIVGAVDGVRPGRVVAFGCFNERLGTEDVIVLAEVQDSLDAAARQRLRGAITAAVRESIGCAVSDVRLLPHMSLLKSSSGKIARSANRTQYARSWRHDSSAEHTNQNHLIDSTHR